MIRSALIPVIAIVLGLALGVNLWNLVGMLGTSEVEKEKIITKSAQKPEETNKGSSPSLKLNNNSSESDTQSNTSTSTSRIESPELNKSAAAVVKLENPVNDKNVGISSETSDEKSKSANDKYDIEADNTAPQLKPSSSQSPDKTPVDASTAPKTSTNKLEDKPATHSAPFPKDMQHWHIRPYKTGCIATQSATSNVNRVDAFEPGSLAMYIFYENHSVVELHFPDWYGFVAPDRGEMSAKLISADGFLIRGITGSTGLSWNDLVLHGQANMDIRLTQCNLDGDCKDITGKLDLSAIRKVAELTFRCANGLAIEP